MVLLQHGEFPLPASVAPTLGPSPHDTVHGGTTAHGSRRLRVNTKQRVFAVSEGGIRVIDFSAGSGMVATGGMDCVVRLWSTWMGDSAKKAHSTMKNISSNNPFEKSLSQ